MFDYERFKIDVTKQMKIIFDDWTKENDDIYIFSLDCTNEMNSIGVLANTTHYLLKQSDLGCEDYWYYKYCEEEWDLFDTFDGLCVIMDKYLCDNKDDFTDPQSHEYTEKFYEHREHIMDCCKEALICFRQYVNQTYPHLLLTFNIREDLEGEERVEIFKQLNSINAQNEYMEHIDDFT